MGGGADRTTPVVTVDDVTVEKYLNQDGLQGVTVSFEIRSNRQEAVSLRLRDAVPREFTVGFNADVAGERWSRTDQGVEFERVLEAGETCRTAYEVGNISAADVTQLTGAPSLEVASGIEDPDDLLGHFEIGAATEPQGDVGALDLELSMEDAAAFDPVDTVFDDAATVGNIIDDPQADEEAVSESEEASSSVLEEAGFQEDAEWSFEEAFEQNRDTEAEAPTEDTGTDTQPSTVDNGPSGSDVAFPSEPDAETIDPHEDSEAIGQPTSEAARESAGWISASLQETNDELEAATAELSAASTGRRTTLAELQAQLETVHDRMRAMEGSLETVEDHATDLAAMLEALESTVGEGAPPPEIEVSQFEATLSDVAEEISLIKTSLASTLETAARHRTALEDLGDEIERTGDTVERIADRTQSITEELAGLRDLQRVNGESLEAVETNQLALQDAVHAMDDRLARLEDQIDDIADSLESEE